MGFTSGKIELEDVPQSTSFMAGHQVWGGLMGSCNIENDDYGAAMDTSMLLQLQRVVSWCVAALVNIDAGCRSNSKFCLILGERIFVAVYFSCCINFSSACCI